MDVRIEPFDDDNAWLLTAVTKKGEDWLRKNLDQPDGIEGITLPEPTGSKKHTATLVRRGTGEAVVVRLKG